MWDVMNVLFVVMFLLNSFVLRIKRDLSGVMMPVTSFCIINWSAKNTPNFSMKP